MSFFWVIGFALHIPILDMFVSHIIKYAAEKLILLVHIKKSSFYICLSYLWQLYNVGIRICVCGNITSENVLKSICCSIIKLVATKWQKQIHKEQKKEQLKYREYIWLICFYIFA